MQSHLSPHVFPAVPTFFRACCHDVKNRNVNAGYEHPGRELARHVYHLCPYSIELDEWNGLVNAMTEMVAREDDDAVLGWFLTYYPRCMELIPKRRRSAFLKGVYEIVREANQ